MAENLLYGFNAVMPLFLLAALGYFLKMSCFISAKGFDELNKLCFRVIMPLLLFKNVYTSDFHASFNPKMLILGEGGVIVLAFILIFICRFLIKDPKKRGSFVHATYRSNYLIMGLPIAESIYGSSVSAAATMLLALVVPTYTLIAVPYLTACSTGGKVKMGSIFLSTIKNPIIIGIFAGLLFNFLQIPMPQAGMSFVKSLAGTATPIAMLTVGARIELKNCINSYTVVCSIVKLIIEPIIFVLLALLLGLTKEPLLIIYILFASPSAINSFTMSSNMGCDQEVAANCVFVTTLLCVLTFTIGIAVLKTLVLI